VKRILFAFFCLFVAVPWSAGAGEAKTPTVKEGCEALCPVCSHYKDGSCEEVKVDGKTPAAEYRGKTYYFCSPSCKRTFLRKPRKFVKATRGN
jgi:YHS domain-containing protein